MAAIGDSHVDDALQDLPQAGGHVPLTNDNKDDIHPHVTNNDMKEDGDVSDQIVFMVQNLSTTQRRRTLSLLKPLIDPLLSSTHVDNDNSQDMRWSGARERSKIVTSAGEVTIDPGSETRIIFEAPKPNLIKLRLFSGNEPVPKGEVDYRSWSSAASRLSRRTDITEEEKCEKLQNSLLDPALGLVRHCLEIGDSKKTLTLLAKAYDNVHDLQDLEVAFQTATQKIGEKSSEYITRLHLLMQELQRRGAIAEHQL